MRAWLYGRGACADFALQSAALVKTHLTEWLDLPPSGHCPSMRCCVVGLGTL